MAKENRAMVSFNLPIELITEILSRLPVKSLLRFKSVCKAWYALINNPNFNEIRRKTNPQISSILVATNRYLYFSSEGIYNPIDFDSLEYKLLGICNGLVFVSFSILQHGFIIGNPTTREFRQVSSPRLHHNGFFLYGFGLFSDEYKFVRVRLSSGYYLAGKAFVKSEVYTMSTDIWVEVDVKVADRVGDFNYLDISIKLPVFLNGVFYWALWNNNQARVVSIDVSDEFYDEIDIPVSLVTLPNDNEDYWRLMVFEEKLSLIIYKSNAEFDLRVLDENKSHWTLKLRIDDILTVQGPLLNLGGNSLMVRGPLQNSSDKISVMSYAENGKILVEDACAKYLKLILYDLNTREIKTLPRIDVQGANKYYFYTESLRSVKLGYGISEAV